MTKFFGGFGPGKKGSYSVSWGDSRQGDGATKNRTRRKRLGDGGGISFQFPPGWDDGSGKIKHVPKGHPHEGRVIFSNRREAIEIAKRHAGKNGEKIRFDPM